MRGDSHDECSKENPDKCAACGKAHPAWSKSCAMRQKEIQRIKIAQENTPVMYEGAETEVSTQEQGDGDPNDMEISNTGWTKVYNRGHKRNTAETATPLSAKARVQATTTPSSSIGEVPDLQPRKIPRTGIQGRARSMSPKKKIYSSTTNRTPLGERSHNMETRHTPASQLKQVISSQEEVIPSQNENSENNQTQIPSTCPSEL